MAVAVRSSTSTAASGANPTGARPSGTASGDILFAVALNNNSQSFNTPAGWTLVAGSNTSGASFWKVATGSEPATWTFSIPGGSGFLSNSNIVVVALTGADTTTPVADSNSAANPGSSTITLPSVTASQANTYVLEVATTVSSGTISPPGSQTVEFDNTSSGNRAYGASEIVGSGATGTRLYTLSASAPFGGGIIAINPAVSNYTGTAPLTETATLTTTGQLGVNSPAPMSITSTIATSGQAMGTSGVPTNVQINTTGSAGTPAPMTITATIATSGSLGATANLPITSTITTSGGTSGTAPRATTASIATTGAASGAPTRTITATLTTTGGATTNLQTIITVGIVTEGVLGGIAINPEKRPLVMDRGLIREANDTDIMILPGASTGGGAPPTLIAEGDSYEVQEDTQVLTFATCKVDGTLIVTGTLL